MQCMHSEGHTWTGATERFDFLILSCWSWQQDRPTQWQFKHMARTTLWSNKGNKMRTKKHLYTAGEGILRATVFCRVEFLSGKSRVPVRSILNWSPPYRTPWTAFQYWLLNACMQIAQYIFMLNKPCPFILFSSKQKEELLASCCVPWARLYLACNMNRHRRPSSQTHFTMIPFTYIMVV